MRRLLGATMMVMALAVASAHAATNSVTFSWLNPKVDIEGNALPTNAVVRYDVLLGQQQDGSDATVVTNVPPGVADVQGDALQTVTLDLATGTWYVNVQAVDQIGQKGPLTTPVAHGTIAPPGAVRDLRKVGVVGSAVSVGVNVSVDVSVDQ